uniref:Uncharacterized protein n=1 Tax=Ciona intestinalis TaxID=7719 RepID=H2Y1U9_CIOIN
MSTSAVHYIYTAILYFSFIFSISDLVHKKDLKHFYFT